jgi:hypothetical protein
MTGETENIHAGAAQTMLDAFTSVGVNRFVLTWRTLQDEEIAVRKHWSAGYIRFSLPRLLSEAEARQLNLIIRPFSPRGFFLQLDDLSHETLERVQPLALFTLATSPGKAQAWLFVEGQGDKDADRDFRRRVKKACGADLMASGAGRLAGSVNFKPRYASDFPRVALTHAAPGRTVSREQLQAMGLVAAPEIPPAPGGVPDRRGWSRGWPDYQRCLRGAPRNSEGTGPDRSRADFLWAKWAIERGWSQAEVAAQLMEISAKAQELRHGELYALGTAREAAAAVKRGWGRMPVGEAPPQGE